MVNVAAKGIHIRQAFPVPKEYVVTVEPCYMNDKDVCKCFTFCLTYFTLLYRYDCIVFQRPKRRLPSTFVVQWFLRSLGLRSPRFWT